MKSSFPIFTSLIHASLVYSFKGEETFPLTSDGQSYACGDSRINAHPSVTVPAILLLREHNRLATLYTASHASSGA